MESNLVILTKFESEGSIINTEQKVLCNEHYKQQKETLDKGYQINRTNSSMPKIWCEVCSPSNWGELVK